MDLKHLLVSIFLIGSITIVSSRVAPSNDLDVNHLPEGMVEKAGLKDWMFEQLIRKALEAFRRLMKKGDTKRNIPVLDPIFALEEKGQFGDAHEIFLFKMENHNVTTTGLSDFTINKVDASMFNLKATIDLTFNAIQRKGIYAVEANVMKDVRVLYGHGLFDNGIKNLNIIAHMDFGLTLKKLYVKDVKVQFNLQEVKFHLDGLLDNSKLGETINQLFTDGSANYINKNRERIQPMVDVKAKQRVSQLIDGMTLAELIAYLQALIDA